MDNIDAPQWTDFTAPSPQITDDYFLRKHDQQDYLQFQTPEAVTPIKSKKSNKYKQPLSESFSENESDHFQTPLKAPPSSTKKKYSSSVKKNNQCLKETTYENVLITAMKNLEFSFKKTDKSVNKSCLFDSPKIINKSVKRVTRSMCSQAANASKLEESSIKLHLEESRNSDNEEENKENLSVKEMENTVISNYNHKIDAVINESLKQDKSAEKFKVELKCKSIENDANLSSKETKLTKSKVVNTFSQSSVNTSNNNLKKKVTALTGTAWHRQMKRRMSLTNRRLSLIKPQNPKKYVSMAEAVSKFQRETPARFHSVNIKTTRTEQLRRQSGLKLTKATSPALMSKARSRPVTALSREERERLELEKIRQNQIKANPVRKDILRRPAALKKVDKKLVTNPEPFHLTETKKGQPPPPKVEHYTQKPEIKRTHHIVKKTVPSIVTSDDKNLVIKDEEVLYFGIPLEPGNSKKKVTKVEPFSFELRNQELQRRKQEKLKALKETEKEKNKAEFHARPVPSTVKTPLTKLSTKDGSAKKTKITVTRSLSFEDRNRETQMKKEAKIKQMLEEERKARSFKAQKVPEFKPVLVKGRSRENLFKRSQENLSAKLNEKKSSHENLSGNPKTLIKKPLSLPFSLTKKESKTTLPMAENSIIPHNGVVPKILEPKRKLLNKSVPLQIELHSDKRAKQRKEFDEKIKKKEMEEEEMKKREEEERIAKENAEKLELRKQAEVKARPMPVYKYMQITKSNKPLTDAESPKWAKPKRQGSFN